MRFLFIFVSRFLGTFLVIRYSCDTILIDMFKISGFSIAVDISNFDLIWFFDDEILQKCQIDSSLWLIN